ncbi:serine/threonine protein kinase [Streptomyces sp. NBC_01433]|uniref:serine/threonine-protein kinase n=1 Tax=Streptomyces sp. NBC_01433 TaxID=2903864 RepID=UPI002253CFD8|nr:serine/threonine-protein kinase [Streptomyces sp. NBC_01433]MCX4675071.1 serine/threonine protein kinase [Streptomyces sp. NBC_01433]
MQPLEAGEPHTIGAYRLLGRLGAGGMGRVYLGRSAGGRTVAVKVVHPHFALDEQFRARFRREVEAARRIGAQWTAPVLDADPDAPVPWVATGYVAGPPLSEAITDHGPLPEDAVRTLGASLAEALAVVHGQGIVHRDVKPSNVLLALDGPRLIDFGIARALGATVSLTSTGVSVGSPGYMAPEQIRGHDVSGAADVFSLGAVLAYAATGTAPFVGDSSAVLLYKVVHEEPELGELEGELREVVAGCLAKDPADRPAPASLARALAPGGAAAMVAGGWLPGPLVREVSRAAVALLDLEPPQDVPTQTGPVPFSDASLEIQDRGQGDQGRGGHGGRGDRGDRSGTAAGAGESGGPGVFGPPFSLPPPTPPAPPLSAASFLSADSARRMGAGGMPEQRTHDPRFSVTVNAESQPAGERRGRRVSCTVALAVASACAVVMVSTGMLTDVLPGSGGEQNSTDSVGTAPSASKAPSEAGSPTPAGSAPTGSGAAQVDALPKEFVGTWKGPLKERTTGQPHGTLTAVFTEGKRGTDVVRMRTTISSLGISVSCHSVGTLSSGTADELTFEERVDPDRISTAGLCTTTTAEVVFARSADGRLRFRSEESGAGLPYGTLTRSGG